MTDPEMTIADALYNSVEVRQRTTFNARTSKQKTWYENMEDGKHLKLTLQTNAKVKAFNPLRVKYNIVKYQSKPDSAILILKKNPYVTERMNDIYLDQAVRIIEHVTSLIQKDEGRAYFSVLVSHVFNNTVIAVHSPVITMLDAALKQSKMIHLVRSSPYVLHFSIFWK